jgi:hypothetical protein
MEVMRRPASRDDNDRRSHQIGRALGRTGHDGPSKGVEVGDAHEPRPAGGNHRA